MLELRLAGLQLVELPPRQPRLVGAPQQLPPRGPAPQQLALQRPVLLVLHQSVEVYASSKIPDSRMVMPIRGKAEPGRIKSTTWNSSWNLQVASSPTDSSVSARKKRAQGSSHPYLKVTSTKV